MKLYPPTIPGSTSAFQLVANSNIEVPFKLNPAVGQDEVYDFRLKIKEINSNKVLGTLSARKTNAVSIEENDTYWENVSDKYKGEHSFNVNYTQQTVTDGIITQSGDITFDSGTTGGLSGYWVYTNNSEEYAGWELIEKYDANKSYTSVYTPPDEPGKNNSNYCYIINEDDSIDFFMAKKSDSFTGCYPYNINLSDDDSFANMIQNNKVSFKLTNDIISKLNIGQFYKIQLSCLNSDQFSDSNQDLYWSGVSVVKAIGNIEVNLVTSTDEAEKNNPFLIVWRFGGQDPSEKLYSYRIQIRQNDQVTILEDSEEILINNNFSQYFYGENYPIELIQKYRLKDFYIDEEELLIYIMIKTVNGYENTYDLDFNYIFQKSQKVIPEDCFFNINFYSNEKINQIIGGVKSGGYDNLDGVKIINSRSVNSGRGNLIISNEDNTYKFQVITDDWCEFSNTFNSNILNGSIIDFEFSDTNISVEYPKGVPVTTTSENGKTVFKLIKKQGQNNFYIKIINSKDENIIFTLKVTSSYCITGLNNYRIIRNTNNFNNSKQIFTNFKVINNDDSINIIDVDLQQGLNYSYGIQSYYIDGQTVQILEKFPDEWKKKTDFDGIIISDNNKILHVKFNPKVSSFKPVIQEQKIETMGSKYPYFSRNSNIYYYEFPINGLISYNMDNDNYFMDLNNNQELARTNAGNNLNINDEFSTSLTADNIYKERVFKQEVLSWLTNGQPKLFRSATEGNFIVRLTGVSLTPNDTLGRMIHSFSATATEVAEYTRENLEKYNLIYGGQDNV